MGEQHAGIRWRLWTRVSVAGAVQLLALAVVVTLHASSVAHTSYGQRVLDDRVYDAPYVGGRVRTACRNAVERRTAAPRT